MPQREADAREEDVCREARISARLSITTATVPAIAAETNAIMELTPNHDVPVGAAIALTTPTAIHTNAAPAAAPRVPATIRKSADR